MGITRFFAITVNSLVQCQSMFRRVSTWWYHSKISKDDAKLTKLKELMCWLLNLDLQPQKILFHTAVSLWKRILVISHSNYLRLEIKFWVQIVSKPTTILLFMPNWTPYGCTNPVGLTVTCSHFLLGMYLKNGGGRIKNMWPS